MVKIRGILNAKKMNVLAQEQGQSYKINFFFHLVYVVLWHVFVTKYVIMTSQWRISWRKTYYSTTYPK